MEVQSFADTVAQLAFDMTYHEHLTYYATEPLAALCARENLALLDVTRVSTHGGSLRALVGRPDSRLARPEIVAARIAQEGDAREQPVVSAGASGASVARSAAKVVAELRRVGRGSPATARRQGHVILNYCGLSERDIEYVVTRTRPSRAGGSPA